VGKSLLGSLGRSAATLLNRTPVPYVSGHNVSIPWRQPSGAEAQMRAMGTVGTLFAIVNRTSNATALVNWRLYRKAASGLKEDRTEVTTHPALQLWNRPNSFYTRQEFVETEQQHIDLTGDAVRIADVDRAADLDGPEIAAMDDHPAAFDGGALRLDHAGGVDHVADHAARGLRRQGDDAARR
jgi:hypothetical protein